MKRIVSLILAVFLLAGVCFIITSCNMETVTGYTCLRDHINETSVDGNPVIINADENRITVGILPEKDGVINVQVMKLDTANGNLVHMATLVLTNQSQDYDVHFMESIYTQYGLMPVSQSAAKVSANGYTGESMLTFTETNVEATSEIAYRQTATGMFNALLLTLDTYCQKNLSTDIEDFGFSSLNDNYRYISENEEVEENDLGGAFSMERLQLAGTMIVVGMGMIFLVLAILWGVLIIFKKVIYDGSNRSKEKSVPVGEEDSVVPTPDNEAVAAMVGAMAYAEDDGAVIAAITAAITEMIASDESLSREFAGGFRVVSFRPKNGKGAWNK